MVVRLVPWEERARGQQEIVRSLIPELSALPGVRAFPTSPAGLGLRGSRTPLQVVIGGPDYQSIKAWSDADRAPGGGEPRPAQRRNRFRAEPAAAGRA